MARRIAVVLCCLAGFVSGCASIVSGTDQQLSFNSEPDGATVTVAGKVLGKTPITVNVKKDKNQSLTFEKEGYACGHLLFGDWALAFIPIKLSDRVRTARQKALAKAPGATDLMNVTITENWTYWLIGSSRCVVVSGEAIKS